MARKKTTKKRKSKFVRRIVRVVVSIFILAGLVLGISMVVKELSATDTNKFAKLTQRLLGKANIHVSEEQIGDVAGEFVSRIAQTNLASGVNTSKEDISSDGSGNLSDKTVVSPTSEVVELLRVGVLSDIQEDLASLEQTLYLLSEESVNTIFILGDLTNYGDTDTLNSVKQVLDSSGMTYYVLPGDHDLAQSIGPENFISVFEDPNQLVEINGVSFYMLNNSANYTEVPKDVMSEYENNLTSIDFLLLSQPLYADDLNAPFKDMYMGHSREEPEEETFVEMQEKVFEQRNEILALLRQSEIKAVLAGDHHKSSKQEDPKTSGLFHYTIGAVSDTVNELPQRFIQTPRFSILTVNSDYTYALNEVLLD